MLILGMTVNAGRLQRYSFQQNWFTCYLACSPRWFFCHRQCTKVGAIAFPLINSFVDDVSWYCQYKVRCFKSLQMAWHIPAIAATDSLLAPEYLPLWYKMLAVVNPDC